MKIIEIATHSPFSNKTEMPFYDNIKDNPEFAKHEGFNVHTVSITPDQYIQASADGFKVTTSSLEQTRTDSGKVDKYAKLMQAGEIFPMLLVQYGYKGSFTQEGLHRAFAAKKLGIEKLPVLVVTEIE